MTKVICSHGFGVAADARGMFTQISDELSDHEFIMFNYNSFDNEGSTIVEPLNEQAKKLQQVIDEQRDARVLLCHSQGSIIAGMVDLKTISKVILLAPPVKMSMERVIEKLMKKPGSEINLEGISKLPRSDGTMTYIPVSYIQSIKGRDPTAMYAAVASKVPTVIIKATDDQVLGSTNFENVLSADVIEVHADHDFTGSGRSELVSLLKTILTTDASI